MGVRSSVDIHLLGIPKIRVGSDVLDVTRLQRPLTLLAYLVVESDRAHPREVLADLFWPGVPMSAALRNLRQLLYRLRRLLRDDEAETPHVWADAQTLQFCVGDATFVDVVRLQSLATTVARHNHRRLAACPSCEPKLVEMAALYRGRFLEGWNFADSQELESWAVLTQESLLRLVHDALHALCDRYVAHGRFGEARECAARLLRFDPWDEAAERLLLRALSAMGQRSRALQEYARFSQTLQTELHLPPEDDTLALVVDIRVGRPCAQHVGPSVLPLPAAPLIGRDLTLAEVDRMLTDRQYRLLTLLGPGGSGKTRLAQYLAKSQAPDWRHGTVYVTLSDVTTAEGSSGVEAAVAAALEVPAGSGRSTETALLAYLRNREVLLILDNFEHLLPDGVSLLRRILQHAPQVKILVTSQARLGEPSEWVVPVTGLAFPAGENAVGRGANRAAVVGATGDTTGVEEEATSQYAAMELFAYHARRVNPHWVLGPDNRACVARICRLVEGLPLALELAASWIRGASACRIADRIAQNVDFLETTAACGPSRHRSLAATFAYAFSLLTDEDRALFCALSVFSGSFTIEHASSVTGATLSSLARLLDRSLIRLSETERWDLHPLLRQYAAERLAQTPDVEAALKARHTATYIEMLATWQDDLWGADPVTALAAVTLDWDNARVAWVSAVAHGDATLLRSAARALYRFLDFRGSFRQGVDLFGMAARKLAAEPVPDVSCALMMAIQSHFMMRRAAYDEALEVARSAVRMASRSPTSRGLACQGPVCRGDDAALRDYALALGLLVEGTVYRSTGGNAEAQLPLERALTVARGRHPYIEAETLRTLGLTRWRLSAYDEARSCYDAALVLDRALGDRRGEAWTLNGLGLIAENQGYYDRALPLYLESLSLVTEIGDTWGESLVQGNLGYLYARVGDGKRAREHYRRDLSICRSLGDRRGESWTQGYLSLLAHQEGRHRVALRHALRSLDLAREVGHSSLISRALTHAGHAWAGRALWEEAAVAYREALALRRAIGEDIVALETQAGLVRVALGRDDVVGAVTGAEEILDYLATHPADRTDEQLRIYLACYQALLAANDSRARGLLDTAYNLLQARAQLIQDPTLRRSFLDGVAVHREIRMLVDQTLEH